MIDKIRNDKQYAEVMKMIEAFISKATKNGGFHTLSKEETKELKALSILAENYENDSMKIMPLPLSIESVVSFKMQEMNLNQNMLAELLNIGTAKLSQILNGKRKPDVPFLKAVHEKLNIDGNFLLEQI